MADCLVTDVLADAALLLADSAQDQFTNAVLLPWYAYAFRELYGVYTNWNLPVGTRDAYTVLAAQAGRMTPAQAGITSMGEPMKLWERPAPATVAVSTVSNTTPIQVTTSAAHNLPNFAEVEIFGVVGPVGVNGVWTITVVDGTRFTLNGSAAGGVYSSAGTVAYSTDNWIEMASVDQIPQVPADVYLRWWKWMQETFFFNPSTNAVELCIEYQATGEAPASGYVGIDDSRNFLAQRTASLVAPQYDMPDTGAKCLMEAFGPSGKADGTGGALRLLVYPKLLEKQNRPRRPMTFRPRRNATTRNLW